MPQPQVVDLSPHAHLTVPEHMMPSCVASHSSPVDTAEPGHSGSVVMEPRLRLLQPETLTTPTTSNKISRYTRPLQRRS
jgi:hypothetical protein